MTWDEQRRELVMFGGLRTGSYSVASETWTWTSAGWCQHFPEHSPSPRAYANMAFDRSHNEVVLFGGLSQGRALTAAPIDTWTWDGTDWTLRKTVHHPTGRIEAGFAFSDTLGHLVLVGGGSLEGNTLTDTWTWDGADWAQLTTPLMNAGGGEVLGFQKSTGNLVMLSGLEVYGEGLEVWVFDGHAWRTTEHIGPELKWSGAAWDPDRSQFVIFGGADTTGQSQSSTVIWDGNWNTRPTTTTPPATGSQSFSPGMAWDPVDGMAILFGGRDDVGNFPTGTWGWDGSGWKLLSD